MKSFRASAIAGVFLTLELLASPAMAANAPGKAPGKAPPKLVCPHGCCDSGLGGPICSYKIGGKTFLLTREQYQGVQQTLQQLHSQNLDQLKNQKAAPK
jgi:hypothetical protein